MPTGKATYGGKTDMSRRNVRAIPASKDEEEKQRRVWKQNSPANDGYNNGANKMLNKVPNKIATARRVGNVAGRITTQRQNEQTNNRAAQYERAFGRPARQAIENTVRKRK